MKKELIVLVMLFVTNNTFAAIFHGEINNISGSKYDIYTGETTYQTCPAGICAGTSFEVGFEYDTSNYDEYRDYIVTQEEYDYSFSVEGNTYTPKYYPSLLTSPIFNDHEFGDAIRITNYEAYIFGDTFLGYFGSDQASLILTLYDSTGSVFDTGGFAAPTTLDLNSFDSFTVQVTISGQDELIIEGSGIILPVPAAIWLFISGLIAIISFSRRNR